LRLECCRSLVYEGSEQLSSERVVGEKFVAGVGKLRF